MAATTTLLGLVTPTQGTLSGTWGDTVNYGISDYLDIAIAGTLSFAGDGAITLANTTGSASGNAITSTTAQYMVIRITGTQTVTKVITGPSYSKLYMVDHAGATSAVTFKASGQTGVSVAVGEKCFVYYNGTDYVKVAGSVNTGVTTFTAGTTGFTPSTATSGAVTLAGTLAVANGGTGLTAGTSGGIPAYTASGTLTSSGVLNQYGVVIGGGAGAVPTSTAVGTATHVLTSNGAGVAPTFQALPGGGVTTFNAGTTGFTPSTATSGAVTLAGTLAIANGGTGTTSTTFANLTTNVTGTLPIANGGTGTTSTTFANLTTNVTGTLPIANGGTNGTATPTANGVVYGTGSTIAYTAAGTTGQVLTATTSSAPTWATPSSSALVYISQVVASNSATVSFTGLTVYDNYMIIWSKAFPTAASTILFTMLTSIDNGSSYATTSYTYGMPIIGSNSTGLSGVAAVTNSTYINLSPDNMNATAADCSISGQVTLNLKDSTKFNFQSWGQVAMYNDGGNTHFSGAFSAARKETSATNAIRFKFTSGNISTGTFRLYGIVNS